MDPVPTCQIDLPCVCFPFTRGFQFDLYKALCYFGCLTFIHPCNSAKSFLLVYICHLASSTLSQLPQWPTSKFCFLTAQNHSSSSSELPDFYWRNGQNGLEWGRGVRTGAGRWACAPNKRQLWDSRQQSSITAGGIPNSHSGWTHFAFSCRPGLGRSKEGNYFSPCLVCYQLLSAISLSRITMRGLFNGAYVWVNLRQ